MSRFAPRGVSRTVNITGPSSGAKSTALGGSKRIKAVKNVRLGAKAIAEEKRRAQQEYARITAGLSDESRRVLARLRGDPNEILEPVDEDLRDVLMADANTNDDGWEDVNTAEPENALNEEAITYALRDLLDPRLNFRKYKDSRTWRDRVTNADERWKAILPTLVCCYLQWRNSGCKPPASDTLDRDTSYDTEIECIDFYALQTSMVLPRNAEQLTAEALVLHGFLGATPDRPTLAVSIPTLELFRDIRRFKPSFSVEAFTKLLCYRYVVPYRRRYRKAIADAYDIYVAITEEIHSQIMMALGRDAPHWRVLHGCPACSYQVEGESPSTWDRMYVMDGNSSLKRLAPVGTRKVGDTRVFSSDYFLSREFVDKYANEVKAGQSQPHVEVPDDLDGTRPDGSEDLEGDPMDGDPSSSCATNWKAAAADEKKRMWGIFEETGIFAAACRHGCFVWLADMVRSGELAKYPLAIVAMMIDVIKKRKLVGFDIGCTFKTTLSRSSLGPAFEASGSRVCVNAFHGYSHAYSCQVQHHPNVIPGMGLEDLETLERIFSSSNQLASVTRYASAYRRMMLIHLFARQWDEEKYTNLAQMLYNNYVQALEIIHLKKPVLDESMAMLKCTREELEALAQEEKQYFATLRDESPWDLHAVAYVEALLELRAASEQLGTVSAEFRKAVPANYTWAAPRSGPTNYRIDQSATQKIESRRRELQETVWRLTSDVIALELQLNVGTRWQPGDQQYDETVKYIATRKYQKALGKLQRLVIQRLFELQKLNLSQTAYRIRTHMAKSLQKRCQAIRNAVKEYNAAALALEPARPTLDWSKVSHFSFLEEFDLLQDTRNDIRERKWAQPLVRETIRTARRVENAAVELANVEREALRVHTSIRDEDLRFSAVLKELRARNDPLHAVVMEFCQRRRAINAHLLVHLHRLFSLDDYKGTTTPGTYCGPARERPTVPSPMATTPGSSSASGENAYAVMHSEPDSVLSQQAPDSTSGEPVAAAAVVRDSAVMDILTSAETYAVELDEEEDMREMDEDERGEVSNLVDHLAQLAVVM